METIKVVCLGDPAVGKTAILFSYATDTFIDQYTPTVFDNYTCNVLVDGTTCHLILVDLAGQQDYAHLRPICFPQTDIFILVYSLTSDSSFKNIKNVWIPEITKHAPNVPYLIVGNKCDENVVHTSDLVCSAKTQRGLKEIFETATRMVLKKRREKKVGGCDCCILM